MNILDKKIRSILKEATFNHKGTDYFLDDESAQSILDDEKYKSRFRNVSAISSADPKDVKDVHPSFIAALKGFDVVKTRAIQAYFQHQKDIDTYLNSGATETFEIGSRKRISEQWKQDLLQIADNDRSGATGKGEILAAVLGRGSGIVGNAAAVDVIVSGKSFSVKYAEKASGPWKVNNIFGSFKASLKNLVSKSDILNVAKNLDLLLQKESFNNEDIILAIIKDSKELAKSPNKMMNEFLVLSDESFKKVSKEPYILFTQNSFAVRDSAEIQFAGLDSQAKVIIQLTGSSSGLRSLASGKDKDWSATEEEITSLKAKRAEEKAKKARETGATSEETAVEDDPDSLQASIVSKKASSSAASLTRGAKQKAAEEAAKNPDIVGRGDAAASSLMSDVDDHKILDLYCDLVGKEMSPAEAKEHIKDQIESLKDPKISKRKLKRVVTHDTPVTVSELVKSLTESKKAEQLIKEFVRNALS